MIAPMDDTICAVATPVGEGGIGIVRISGEKATELASRLIRLGSGKSLSALASHTLYHADVLNVPVKPGAEISDFTPLDEALVVVMRAPHSYTAEDVVEIHCHGGPLILQKLCERLIDGGARLAEPGEFTKRAFLNGRLNLTQAEAVLDTIRAKTAGSLRIAQEQLRGALSKEIDRIRDTLIRLLAHVEAAIDFTEEDITFIRQEELIQALQHAKADVSRLADTYHEGRVFRDGVTVAIIGRPNVGKSSLLNALVGTDRAIVTSVPGTTRDVLEEVLNVRGVPMRVLDTAGIRETGDAVEQEGVRRSRAAMTEADLVLVMLDGSTVLGAEDRELLACSKGKNLVVVVNKTDLACRIHGSELAEFERVVWISVKTGGGLEELRDTMRSAVLRADFEPGEAALVTRLRHRVGLVHAQEALLRALESAGGKLSGEFLAVDLRSAIDALSEITGAVSTDDILDRIFSEFCIGK